jgi:hypothetical protein
MEGVVEARLVSDNSSEDSSDRPNTIRAILGPAAKVYSFPDFLREYVPSLDVDSILDVDTPMSPLEHHQLAQTRVAPLESLKHLSKVCKSIRRDESLSSLVDDVVWSLVQRRERQRRLKEDGRNQLSLGYAVASYYQSSAAQSCTNMPAGVIMKHLNANVDFCKTSSLCRLIHRMVGDDVMRTLLLHTSIFVPVEEDLSQPPRGNYFQLTGPPLQGTSTRSTETNDKSSRKRKRLSQRQDDPTKSAPRKRKRLSQRQDDPTKSAPKNQLGSDTNVALTDQDTSVVNGLGGKTLLVDLGLQTSIEQLLSRQLRDLIELELVVRQQGPDNCSICFDTEISFDPEAARQLHPNSYHRAFALHSSA